MRRYRQCSVDGGGAEGIFIKPRVTVSKLVVAAVAAFARRQRCSFPFSLGQCSGKVIFLSLPYSADSKQFLSLVGFRFF